MKANRLQKLIDEMVSRSIRKILPEIMNEVLLRTVVNSGIIQERAQSVRREVTVPKVKQSRQLPSSLTEMLDDSTGADFYRQGDYGAGEMWEQSTSRGPTPPIAQRISDLPPELRILAEDTVQQMSVPQGDSIDLNVVESIGFDFNRMRQSLGILEEKSPRPISNDPSIEERRIARLRESLEVKVG